MAVMNRIIHYLQWFWHMDGKTMRMEIGRHIFPSVRRQYDLDRMVGPIGYWSQLQSYQYGALKKLGLQPNHRLLDVGCGPLQGGLAFIAYLDPGNYTGIDVSEKSIIEAKNQVEKASLPSKKPFLAVSDSFGKKELNGKTFDYIWCSQMLYHLDEIQIDRFFKQISIFLAADGKFYGDIIGFPNKVNEDSRWNGFHFHLYTVDALKKIAGRHRLKIREAGQIVSFGYPAEIDLHTNEMLELTKE